MRLSGRLRATVDRRPLFEALKARYPKYKNDELERLESLIVQAVADAIRSGKHISFIDTLPNGEIELDALYVSERADQIANEIGMG